MKALEYINSKGNSEKHISIFSSSSTTIKAISEVRSHSAQVQQIINEVRSAQKNNIEIKFSLIERDSSFELNKLTVKLAKEGAISHKSIEYDLVPFSFIKSTIRHKNLKTWNGRWTSSTKGSTTRQFIPNIDDRIALKKTFITDFYVTQLITNHGNFNCYLTLFKLRNDESCDYFDSNIQDSEHYIFSCPKFDEIRVELKSLLMKNGKSIACNLSELIKPTIFKTFQKFCSNIFKI
jgi:hypothetical protein